MKRKYLTSDEVYKLLDYIYKNRHNHRDYCMVSMAFIHGLRVSELIELKLTDYESISRKIYIHRLKGGLSTTHPLLDFESKALEMWLNERRYLKGNRTPWMFLSRHGGSLSRQRFYQLLKNYGEKAQLSLSIHPHMLRHACGYNLAELGNDTRLIQDYLGHRSIRHTVLYTAANAERFNRAWVKDGNFICPDTEQK
ncbi:transcriptional regulator [Escherichia coli]|uniref:tyrosine-type DNA invertase n=1 Tax=Escherichia coli TaxID=562 RepID=UPI00025C92F8|nr:tyrosine-type DNA invertase [Escherichia coli]EFA6161676.1 tyrosine-type recombinase/integrase [Escherichia coli]EFC7499248.1 tyrosine-type recombinase/integrase [Escherichia coli]EFH0679481.1 tyrosine-type recombinase/integrase [Escherichia coli]EFN0184354.1 tyrosine-type recombinase/integrase [Escherichia coli]EIH97676.1 type 1 fimbriae regulatory protein FimB [Escherichia coli 96.154]